MNAFYVVGAILMILGACPIPSPIDLWKLGTAFVVLGFTLPLVMR